MYMYMVLNLCSLSLSLPVCQFMVMSFTMKRLLIYEREEDMETDGPGPITTLEFSQIYTVRTLRPGEHETLRVKQSDVKKILVVRPGGRGDSVNTYMYIVYGASHAQSSSAVVVHRPARVWTQEDAGGHVAWQPASRGESAVRYNDAIMM